MARGKPLRAFVVDLWQASGIAAATSTSVKCMKLESIP
jgi:hypothetical protein